MSLRFLPLNSLKCAIIIALCILCPALLPAQKDSLLRELEKAKQDTTQLRLCLAIAAQQTNNNLDTTFFYCNKAEAIAKKLNNRKGIADVNYQRAYAIFYDGNGDSALKMFNTLLPEYRALGDSGTVAACLNKMGYIYRERSQKQKALTFYQAALKANINDTNLSEAANSYLNIGLIHHDEKQYDLALKYELQGLALYEKTTDKGRTANALARLGNLYADMKDDSTGLVYHQRALAMAQEAGNNRLIGICLNNIAGIYLERKEPQRALGIYRQALDIRMEIGDKNGISVILNNMGACYSGLKKFDSAFYYLDSSLAMARRAKFDNMIETNYESYSLTYAAMGNYKLAYEWSVTYHEEYEKNYSEENAKEINRLNALNEAEERDHQIEELSQQSELDQVTIQQEKTRGWFLVVGLGALVIVALLIWMNKRKTDRTNVILEEQKSEINEKKKIVEEQHRDIVDSINYALRIQHAVMPSRQDLKRMFPESFLFYKPRDIVSGDFWWITEKDGLKVWVVADCTGHGVPGAFMSLIGTSLLNEIINENGVTDPGEILNLLSARVVKALHQREDRATANDGMDIALVVIDEKNEVLRFAGANNSLCYTTIDGELKELKGDRQPVGYYLEQHKPFSVQTLSLTDVTNLWMYTDGYPDQFCGNAGSFFGKKFKYSRLRAKLTEVQGLNVIQQRELLAKTFEDWKGEMFQVDDVLMMGIKFY